MASNEHLEYSIFIKNVHKNLRENSKNSDNPENVWLEHTTNNDFILKTYSNYMKSLSEIWDKNHKINCNKIQSRIEWTILAIEEYFGELEQIMLKRNKELQLIEDFFPDDREEAEKSFIDFKSIQFNLLDVGSCFNPFGICDSDRFNVTAFDLCPENDSVLKGDFLKIQLDSKFEQKNNFILSLPIENYHVIVFSLLLEYIPTSNQRIICCQKAYDLLKSEGLLIICTPDSKHVGANAKLMKNWRNVLANIGFSRIKFEKLSHITCMVFRKSIHKALTVRWATIHKEIYMNNELEIPQDI